MNKASYSVLFLLVVCAVAVKAQQSNNPVSVKDDQFSGKRTVKLESQQISQTLTVSISAEIDTRTKGDRPLRDLGTCTLDFVSTTARREYATETEFNFLVDGKPVKGGTLISSPLTDKRSKDGKELAHAVMNNGSLQDIGRGREVKLKIGEQIFDLDKALVHNIATVYSELVK
jgi:hypothetical protein